MKKKTVILLAALPFLFGATAKAAGNSDNDKVSLVPKITGMVNLRYSYNESKKDDQGFEVRRVRLGTKGDLHRKVDYVFQAEYAGRIRILDAYLRWKIRPEFNVQVGEFKVHYSQETLLGPATWLTVNTPAAVDKLNGYSDYCGLTSNNGRDIGFMFYGGLVHKDHFDVLRYRLGLFNGNGINVKDNNRKKDVSGMIWVNPIRQLSFTGAYHAGSYGPRGDDHVRNRASAGVEWKDKKLNVRSEYLWGNTAGQHSHGVYAQAAYTIHQIVQPVLSYDYLKQDSHDGAPYQHNLQVGVNVSPIDHLRLQAAYTHTLSNNSHHNNLAEVQCVLTY